jgi:hypothetical protein
MNFNLVEMYNGLLRFNKHILNELAEGLKHLPNLDGISKGDSLIINEQGNPAWGSAAFIPTLKMLALVALILIGFGPLLMLLSASLLRLNLIK